MGEESGGRGRGGEGIVEDGDRDGEQKKRKKGKSGGHQLTSYNNNY
jgi:hypothetical protein